MSPPFFVMIEPGSGSKLWKAIRFPLTTTVHRYNLAVVGYIHE